MKVSKRRAIGWIGRETNLRNLRFVSGKTAGGKAGDALALICLRAFRMCTHIPSNFLYRLWMLVTW